MGEWSRRAYRREGTRMAVMTRRQRRWFAALGGSVVVGALFAWLPLQAAAADLRQGPSITVGAGQTINDDIYAAGGTISIDGNVNGSVIAAGGTITISGTVSRDVMIAGGTVNVSGKGGGSIRAAGGKLTLNAPVEQDVVVTGGTVDIGSGGDHRARPGDRRRHRHRVGAGRS